MELPGALFNPRLKKKKKQKKKHSKKIYFHAFREMELSGTNITKFLIFSEKKAFFIFLETESPKKLLLLQETELSYISGNGNRKKPLIFQGVTYFIFQRARNNKIKEFLF